MTLYDTSQHLYGTLQTRKQYYTYIYIYIYMYVYIDIYNTIKTPTKHGNSSLLTSAQRPWP